jgi:glyoxylase-like metal-dependent hydrolase (beta-lactamase superfamily II)
MNSIPPGTNTMTIKHTIAAGMLAALIALSGTANAQGGFGPPELTTVKVRDNIYVIRSGMSGNVTVLVSDDGVLLIDDKFAMDHDGIMAQLAKITSQPVRRVINTHLHQDHTGGNAQMQALKADVIASENARRIMAETQTEGLPNITIDDYLRIYLGDMPVDLHYFGRGHTDGDIVIHLPTERLVVMGDLFATWEPYVHLIHYAAGGSARDWSRSLERALQLDFDTVIPGHSGVTDRATMEGYLAETVRLQSMVREMNRARRSRDDIKAMLAMEFGWSDFMMNFGLDGLITEMQ